MKKSRTYTNCESILKEMIRRFGPTAKIAWPLLRNVIIEFAGGDQRTIHSYRNNMILLDFIREEKGEFFTFNIMKVDFKQLGLKEVLVVEEEEPP